MFRARKITMLEQALCDAKINPRVGLGKDIVDKIAEHGNWQESGVLVSLEKIYVVFIDGNDVQNTTRFTVQCSLGGNPATRGDYWIVEAYRYPQNNTSVQEWSVYIWDFRTHERILRTVCSEYDLTGKKLSCV